MKNKQSIKFTVISIMLLISFLFQAAIPVSAKTEQNVSLAGSEDAQMVAEPSVNRVGTAAWTFMVYLDADNDLETAGIEDFIEMSAVGSSTDVNIVVQFDRSTSYNTDYGNWTDARRFLVTTSMDPTAANGTSIGEVNMGDPQTLVDFVTWSQTNYPADHYALIIWDHGSGWRLRSKETPVSKGIAYDDSHAGDGLTMPELYNALDQIKTAIGKPLDLVGMDACLMAMIEVDNQLAGFADVRVGSEDLEPGDGWPYTPILNYLISTPATTAADFGSHIVDEYYAEYGNDQTQSAVYLGTELTDLNNAVDVFAEALITDGASHLTELETARNNTQEFDYSYYIDLYDFAHNVSQEITTIENLDIHNAAEAVKIAVNAAIINNKAGASWPDAHGISIYFPRSEGEYDSRYDGSQNFLQFTEGSDTTGQDWDEWLHFYYDTPNATLTNDEPANAITVFSLPYTKTQSVSSATTGVNDPVPGCIGSKLNKSVWYQYTPVNNEIIVIDTIGSNYDTVLTVYSDTDPSAGLSLSQVVNGCNDDITPGTVLQSQVQVNVTSGTTYYIEVMSWGGTGSDLTLNIKYATPANDEMTSATLINTTPYSIEQNTTTATTANDDPDIFCQSTNLGQGVNSVWYEFTPNINGMLYLDTYDSDFDTVAAVWTYSFGSLVSVGCNDDSNATLQSEVNIPVRAGTTYYIEIVGYVLREDSKPAQVEGDRRVLQNRKQLSKVSSGSLHLYVELNETTSCGVDDNLNLFTTGDNSNNTDNNYGDCDMDTYLFNDSTIHPLEFTIDVADISGITSADLLLLNWDVDEDNGEVDQVYFNNNFAGTLTGANDEWSTTALTIDPAWIEQGENVVRIEVDTANAGNATFGVTLDWGQLVINNQGHGSANVRTITNDKTSYQAGQQVNVSVEVDTTQVTQNVHTEINLRSPSGTIITGTVVDHILTGVTNDAVNVSFTLPTGIPTGVYNIQVLIYDANTYLFEDSMVKNFKVVVSRKILSVGTYDGWILESSENSSIGGTMNSNAVTFSLGDSAADQQYRAILHFNTAVLPDNAVITSAILQIKKSTTAGSNPFNILGSLRVDAHKPSFGTTLLQLTDFQTVAARNQIGIFSRVPVNNWYSSTINKSGRAYINKVGTTQFKIYFSTGDNDDSGADIMNFFSGNAGATSRPKLIIEYYIR